MERKPMQEFNFSLSEGKEGGSDASSSPEDETPNSFHTPHHDPLPRVKGLPLGCAVASQDSMDIFLDAPSILTSSPLKPPLYINGDVTKRKRHASYEIKPSCASDRREDEDNWEEADENTCMLQNDLRKQRVRRWSSGQGSRSCTSSPFHVGHFSFSTNSLKRNIDKSLASSPRKHPPVMPAAVGASCYTPHKESVGMIAEERCAATRGSSFKNGPPVPAAAAAHAREETSRAEPTPKWVSNYVACVEMNKFGNGTVPREGKITTISLENQWKNEEGSTSQVSNRVDRKKGCCHYLKEEFRATNLKLKHKSPHLFATSQWQHQGKMSCLYLGYRLFWSVYFLMWGVWSFVGTKGYFSPLAEKAIYFIYFPNWGLWILVVDATLQAINVVLHMKKIASDGDAKYLSMNTRLKLSWALSNISSSIVLLNTILFWTLVFKPSVDAIDEITANVQVIPFLYVLFDAFISATPRRILHAYFPMFFAGIYGTFSLVYFLLGGTNSEGRIGIYPLLEWKKPGHTLVTCMFILLVLIPTLHFGLCALFKLRVRLWRKLKISRSEKCEAAKIDAREEKV